MIATNRYVDYAVQLIQTADKLRESPQVQFLIATDNPSYFSSKLTNIDNIKFFSIPSYGWPEVSYKRYEILSDLVQNSQCDFYLHIDADTLIEDLNLTHLRNVSKKNQMAFTSHPGYWHPFYESKLFLALSRFYSFFERMLAALEERSNFQLNLPRPIFAMLRRRRMVIRELKEKIVTTPSLWKKAEFRLKLFLMQPKSSFRALCHLTSNFISKQPRRVFYKLKTFAIFHLREKKRILEEKLIFDLENGITLNGRLARIILKIYSHYLSRRKRHKMEDISNLQSKFTSNNHSDTLRGVNKPKKVNSTDQHLSEECTRLFGTLNRCGFFLKSKLSSVVFECRNIKGELMHFVNWRNRGTWELDSESYAFTPRTRRLIYFCGGIWMGPRLQFLHLCMTCDSWFKKDLDRGFFANWFDESYLNAYASKLPKYLVLDPGWAWTVSNPRISTFSRKICLVEKVGVLPVQERGR